MDYVAEASGSSFKGGLKISQSVAKEKYICIFYQVHQFRNQAGKQVDKIVDDKCKSHVV